MNIRVFCTPPDPELARELGRFEREFQYPLGADRAFRISHSHDGSSGDGWSFFQALGPAVYIVAYKNNQVIGTIGAALRNVTRPDGSVTMALYIGDLKISQIERGGSVLFRLLQSLQTWSRSNTMCTDSTAFSIVMDGTAITPNNYTGRLSLPAMSAIGTSAILWMNTRNGSNTTEWPYPVSSSLGEHVFFSLVGKQYYLPVVRSHLRSQLTPCWLVSSNAQACGQIEDTRLNKTLWAITGEEMRSAHLSHFCYTHLHSAIDLVSTALKFAFSHGYPMLFITVPSSTVEQWRAHFGHRIHSIATATIFGTSNTLPVGPWLINTADI